MTASLGLMAAYAPFFLLHVAMIVFGAIGGRRQRATAFWLLVASGGLGVASSTLQVLQFTLIRDYGVSRLAIFGAVTSTIGMAAGTLEVVAVALLALRRPAAPAVVAAPPSGQITR
jgi:hypothetical protein